MGFNRRSQQRIGDVVRRVEKSPFTGSAGKRTRRQVATSGSQTKYMILLNDDFEQETIAGESWNASTGSGDDIKYYNVTQQFAEGKYWAGDAILATKVGNTWYCISDGYLGGRVQITSDMTGIGTSNSATADLLPSGGEIEVTARYDFKGLKTGHEVIVSWLRGEFVVVDMEDKIATGTTDEINGYPASNVMNWNLIDGVSTVGIFKSGSYLIIGARCS